MPDLKEGSTTLFQIKDIKILCELLLVLYLHMDGLFTRVKLQSAGCCTESNFKFAIATHEKEIYGIKVHEIKSVFFLPQPGSVLADTIFASINHAKLNNQIEFKICARAIMLITFFMAAHNS